MTIAIKPKQLKGTLTAPPSKSIAHRAIICAALAKGISHITNIQYSDDILATIEAMKTMGAIIEEADDGLMIDGTNVLTTHDITIDADESGSTLRFLMPVSLIAANSVRWIGQGRLSERPLNAYYDIFDEQGIIYESSKGILDLLIKGQLQPGTFVIPGNVSSQYISGLLFALPLLDGESIITITSPLQSSAYVDLTIDMLKRFGVTIINHDYRQLIIKGHQSYQSHDERIEADYSQAAFYLVADVLGSDVVVKGLNSESKQGDRVIIDFLEAMGATVAQTDESISLKAEQLKAIEIDASQCPDLMPVMAVACAYASGTSRIINASRLRLKECDRLHAMKQMLENVGIEVREMDDSLTITGGRVTSGFVKTYHDHRMAMAAAILATRASGDVVIDDEACVKKSYPEFFEDFKRLEGEYYER